LIEDVLRTLNDRCYLIINGLHSVINVLHPAIDILHLVVDILYNVIDSHLVVCRARLGSKAPA